MTVTPYVVYTAADTFWAEYPSTVTATWTALSTANKTAYLVMATKAIDALDFKGFKYLSTQERQFPRKYILDPNYQSPWGLTLSIDAYGYCYESSVPTVVTDACCWEAKALAEHYASSSSTSRKTLQDQGVKSFSIGDLSESFGGKSTAAASGLQSSEAFGLVQKYIETSGNLV
jgi:hypothetical protein